MSYDPHVRVKDRKSGLIISVPTSLVAGITTPQRHKVYEFDGYWSTWDTPPTHDLGPLVGTPMKFSGTISEFREYLAGWR
jgi:hypothetical protein